MSMKVLASGTSVEVPKLHVERSQLLQTVDSETKGNVPLQLSADDMRTWMRGNRAPLQEGSEMMHDPIARREQQASTCQVLPPPCIGLTPPPSPTKRRVS
jgi:hypothetical protein